MTTPLKAGTPSPGPLLYTNEQLAQLEKMKDPAYDLGIARKAHVNHILCPDGTVLEPSETKKMVAAIRKRAKQLLNEAAELVSQASEEVGDDENDSGPTPSQIAAQEAMSDAAVLLTRVDEIDAHIKAKRFLFIVDEYMVPQIYFQCATPDNPDLPRRKKEK